jgi:hypothetical protein
MNTPITNIIETSNSFADLAGRRRHHDQGGA